MKTHERRKTVKSSFSVYFKLSVVMRNIHQHFFVFTGRVCCILQQIPAIKPVQISVFDF